MRRPLRSLLLVISPLTFAADPGAWENYASQANADAWTVYDYADEVFYFPQWENEDPDPYIYLDTLGEEGLWIIGDDTVGQGAFTGNFASADVSGLAMDLYIDDPTIMDFFDVAILAGPTPTYYFSRVIAAADFPQAGFYPIEVLFNETWFVTDANGDYFPVELDAAILSNVQEVGVRSFPLLGNTEVFVAGLDNVLLLPKITSPALSLSIDPSSFTLAFQRRAGHLYRLRSFDSQFWTTVPGEGGITGTTPYQYTAPTSARAIFQVTANEHFTPVVSLP